MQVRNEKSRICILLQIAVLLTLSMTGCERPYYSHSFKTDMNNTKALQVVVLTPTDVPSELPQAEIAKQVFDTAISEKLTQAGFQVVTQDVYAEKLADVTREKGGAFDTITGALDENKFQELQRAALEQIQPVTDARSLLRAKVKVVTAKFAGCDASWDGTTQELSTTILIFCSSADMFGTVDALSLLVTLEDMDGNVFYFNGGGIQLFVKHSYGASRDGFYDVSKEELLADQTRNRAAVDHALAPLLRGGFRQP